MIDTAASTSIVVNPIGWVRSGLTMLDAAPRQPDEGAPPATLELLTGFEELLDGLAVGDRVVVVTWLHRADRSARTTHPRGDVTRPVAGVFATRSPDRPNPIGLHTTTIERIDGARVQVNCLEAVDGTPILDLKPTLDEVPAR
ncbi:MAG TPA: tRNA (N6-threonylcarbamoyladenosine(37)-N6)-methyltransferase TrmO [Jatrophihabitans sp.]|jgi:tRNA-Thr(GGU) m(6)t(6)A37 methyltransferase TsaA